MRAVVATRGGRLRVAWPRVHGPLHIFKLTETACLALSNVVFHCADNQQTAIDLGVVDECLRLLQRPSGGANGAVQVGALNLLINLTDTNATAQRTLSTEEAADGIHRLLCVRGNEPLVCSACLLISHATWNCPPNQARFGTQRSVRQLLVTSIFPGGAGVAKLWFSLPAPKDDEAVRAQIDALRRLPMVQALFAPLVIASDIARDETGVATRGAPSLLPAHDFCEPS